LTLERFIKLTEYRIARIEDYAEPHELKFWLIVLILWYFVLK